MSVPQNRRAGIPAAARPQAGSRRQTCLSRSAETPRQADDGWIENLTARSAATRWIIGVSGWRTRANGAGIGVANDCQAIN